MLMAIDLNIFAEIHVPSVHVIWKYPVHRAPYIPGTRGNKTQMGNYR